MCAKIIAGETEYIGPYYVHYRLQGSEDLGCADRILEKYFLL